MRDRYYSQTYGIDLCQGQKVVSHTPLTNQLKNLLLICNKLDLRMIYRNLHCKYSEVAFILTEIGAFIYKTDRRTENMFVCCQSTSTDQAQPIWLVYTLWGLPRVRLRVTYICTKWISHFYCFQWSKGIINYLMSVLFILHTFMYITENCNCP